MPPQESPAQVARLRTALAIGRQQRSQWPTHAKKLAAAREQHSACSHPPVLDLGVITAPSNGMRRRRIRQARDLLLADDARCSVVITFLLGSLNMFSAAERKLVAAEREHHNDLLLLRAHDGALASAASHGGRAVAEKALAWFIHSANHSRAHFVAKVDDDSMVSLPRLVSELRAVMATAPRPESAHFGVHLYRLWDWQKQARVPNAACGRHDDSGPPHRCDRLLARLTASVQPGGQCAGASGPFAFLDGSFEVVGKRLLRDVFGSARVRAFARTEFERRGPPYWSHEDAGLGALIHRELATRALPVTYVALRRWEHNRFWLNWADRSTLLDADVLWAHYTRSAERADYVAGAFAAFAPLPADGVSCGDCASQWGWQAAPGTFRGATAGVSTAVGAATTCCSKPKPSRRLAPPRTLRLSYAMDRALNLTCTGFEGGGAASGGGARPAPKYMLTVLSLSNEADERYELRRLLRAPSLRARLLAHGDGTLQTCFVFDPTPPHGGRRRPGQLYNTRAWLLFEAGRRADFDLTALSPLGDFSDKPESRVAMRRDASAHGWQRAAAHARGPAAAEFYAVVTTASLLAQGPAGFGLSTKPPTWVPREAAVMAGDTYASLRRHR